MMIPRLSLAATVLMWVVAGPATADDEKIPCPYEVDHDAPLNATESTVKEADDHTQLRVEFNGIKKDRVPGFLYLPKNSSSKRCPTVLMQYGSGGHKGVDYIVEMGHRFVARGFVVLTIDSPGRGERRNNDQASPVPGTDGWRDGFLQYLSDYSRALDYLVTRPEVDTERIGYLGISYGAITGIPFVAHEPRVKAMVSMVGGGGFVERLSLSRSEKVKELARQIDPVYHVGLISPRPLLLLNVTKDELIPKPTADALHEAAGPGSKVLWMETNHYFQGVDRQKLAVTLAEFFEQNLPKGSG